MTTIDSFPVEVSSCFHTLGVCLEVTVVVRQVFDLLVITDVAKYSGFASFRLSTRESLINALLYKDGRKQTWVMAQGKESMTKLEQY